MNNELAGVDETLLHARSLAKANHLIRLADMDGHSTNSFQDILDWYDQAASMFAFLYKNNGLSVLGKIVGRINDGELLQDSISHVTCLTMDEYEKQRLDTVVA